MKRIAYKLLLGLLLICPVCERGRLYATQFTMHQYCPRCGAPFQRSTGEATGGMAITLVLVMAMGMGMGIPLVILTPISLWAAGGCLGSLMMVFAVVFYRHARGLWVSILYLLGGLSEG